MSGRPAWLLAAALAALGLVVWLALPDPLVQSLVAEGGPVERGTELLYLGCAIAVWAHRARQPPELPLRLSLTMLFVAAAAREADWHKAWTETSVLKLSYYLDAEPSAAMLAAAAVVLALLAAIAHLVWRAVRGLVPALRRGQAFASTIVVLLVTLVLGKLLDRSKAVLAEDWGFEMAPAVARLVSVQEEALELALPLLAALALRQYLLRPAPGDLR